MPEAAIACTISQMYADSHPPEGAQLFLELLTDMQLFRSGAWPLTLSLIAAEQKMSCLQAKS